MSSDKEQRSIFVPQHKRLAMGEKLDGTSYQPKGQQSQPATRKGALPQKKK